MNVSQFIHTPLRDDIRALTLANEAEQIRKMVDALADNEAVQQDAVDQAIKWVEDIRSNGNVGLMESLLAEYGLSTQEGVALMCLAEAYLRVPDSETLDELIVDKIAPQDFGKHMGHSSSLMVNASTWGLMLTGGILSKSEEQNLTSTLRSAVRRLGEPVIRVAVKRMMRVMGSQFVLGESIESAIKAGRSMEKKGYSYSYDMLGEAALTHEDANRYYLAYADAISEIAKNAKHKNIADNPGISVKLSALHPRYETLHREELMDSLLSSIRSLCYAAMKANIGLNIDAEEAERLDISLDIIEQLIADTSLQGWDGLGIVVQAYGYRAPKVIEWLHECAQKHDRKIMVRLVKGAYWDREIKRSQELGIEGYPVFTRKHNTDTSYLYCAELLLQYRDVIYPQFATHNAHTVSYILSATRDEKPKERGYEFQRLHGMGESLYDLLMKREDIRCRIYAPVGVHQDLLAYLVRRLLENGANASFVNQLLDEEVEPSRIVANPVDKSRAWLDQGGESGVQMPHTLFYPERENAQGWDWLDPQTLESLLTQREAFADQSWDVKPIVSVSADHLSAAETNINPANQAAVGEITESDEALANAAIEAAHQGQEAWAAKSPRERGDCLRKASDLYESNAPELLAILAREAGKTIQDGIAEIREAVDFLRYYAAQAEAMETQRAARGVVGCISPWNFPLAIFTGQLSAALVMGNAVVVKPAEATPIVAQRAIEFLHQAGVPVEVCQFLPGAGRVVGEAMSKHPLVQGMVFTGSTATAKRIEKNITAREEPEVALVAETGGLNAMIVDSTALPEQAIVDIIASAFQSAGQRCSALRMLYLQEDVAEKFLEMLYGAMDCLSVGNTWDASIDIGPIIGEKAQQEILEYIEAHQASVTKKIDAPTEGGFFVPPTVIRVNGIEDLEREIFGPVLHVATFDGEKIDEVIQDINAKGYGLTFGLHTRIDSRVQQVFSQIKVGNTYVNRNQIGAIVGSQPFGGEGMSGTGPKAGGPNYLYRLSTSWRQPAPITSADTASSAANPKRATDWSQALSQAKEHTREIAKMPPLGAQLAEPCSELIAHCRQRLPATRELPGPTGEQNLYTLHPRGVVVILTPDLNTAIAQVMQALYAGNAVLWHNDVLANHESLCEWIASVDQITQLAEAPKLDWVRSDVDIAALVYTPEHDDDIKRANEYRHALAEREGALIPLIADKIAPYMYVHERHLCVNTTAAGGNVELLSATKA